MLSTITSQANLRRPVWVSADTLNVSPELLGAPLASPLRRLLAIGIDLLVVAILSSLDAFWLGVAVVVFLYQMRSRDQAQSWLRRAWLLGACVLCLWLAAEQGWHAWSARHTAPAGATEAASPASSAPARPAAAASAAEDAPHEAQRTDAERIEALEEALAEARKPQALVWQSQLKAWWDGLGVGFGWAIVYFSLVPAWLRGQSLGKMLLGLRVVELTGRPLTVRVCFSRYGGYAAGMATGMFGFAQILWDANRQSIQDKVAHTVVVDLRAPYRRPEPLPASQTPSTSENTSPIALGPR